MNVLLSEKSHVSVHRLMTRNELMTIKSFTVIAMLQLTIVFTHFPRFPSLFYSSSNFCWENNERNIGEILQKDHFQSKTLKYWIY